MSATPTTMNRVLTCPGPQPSTSRASSAFETPMIEKGTTNSTLTVTSRRMTG